MVAESMLMPEWQVMLAMCGVTFFLQHKWPYMREFLETHHAALAECAFCLGALVGATGWTIQAVLLVFSGASTWPANLAVFFIWVFGTATASLLTDALVLRLGESE